MNWFRLHSGRSRGGTPLNLLRRICYGCRFLIACLILCTGVVLSEETELESEPGSDDKSSEEPDAETETEDEQSLDESDSAAQKDHIFDSLADILAYESSDDDYKLTKRCIDRREVEDYDILNQRFIVVQMRKDEEKYLIQLPRKCVGLTKGALLSFDVRRSGTLRMCANDSIRASIGTEWGPPCRIPGFEPVNDVQLEQLTRGLYSGRVE
ncbi:MAG: hypothetical protein OXG08_08080 [Gammaproteobacteria bacterium]|nr:hypothetical protein [Gammaproteobacteria bacterium]